MSKDESGIVRSQYSNYLGTDSVVQENSEKSAKKLDLNVESAIRKQNMDMDIQKRKDHTYLAEQDAEPGYDMLNGVINNPSNLDLVDGLVDSEEELRSVYAGRGSHLVYDNAGKRPSVLEALKEKKEIVQQRERERQIMERERNISKDPEYAR